MPKVCPAKLIRIQHALNQWKLSNTSKEMFDHRLIEVEEYESKVIFFENFFVGFF
jgi:hypothetical protein